MRYSLFAPGKRLRPILALLANSVCDGNNEEAIPAAVALEMVHTYSLIHDDLPAMDNDDLRRGRPTCHKQFDEATAILAGDGLLTYAFDILSSRIKPDNVASKCCFILSRAAGPLGMVAGQQDDMDQKLNPGDDVSSQQEFLLRIHQNKTAALIIAALNLGATIANANADQIVSLTDFGKYYGLAFQITDDILDAVGDEKEVGKKTRKDAEQGKLTFITCYGLEKSRKLAEENVEKACLALSFFDSTSIAVRTLRFLARQLLTRNK